MIRLLCLSADPALLLQVEEVFSENRVQVTCYATPTAFASATESSSWDAYFVDIDVLMTTGADPHALLARLNTESKKTIAVVSANFADWYRNLYRHDTLVLDKPVTTGEIVLALRRLTSEQAS